MKSSEIPRYWTTAEKALKKYAFDPYTWYAQRTSEANSMAIALEEARLMALKLKES